MAKCNGMIMHNIELYTIGHSNHSLEMFLDLLQQHEIQAIVDIRRFPTSRTFPEYDQNNLLSVLSANGIEYVWIESLGGRRAKVKDFVSPNPGLRNDSFRNYADYMLTGEFRSGMDKLAAIANSKRTAIMCAENVFWRCHRKLVSDYVVANGGSVRHIFPAGECKPHSLSADARVEAGRLTYPGSKTLFD